VRILTAWTLAGALCVASWGLLGLAGCGVIGWLQEPAWALAPASPQAVPAPRTARTGPEGERPAAPAPASLTAQPSASRGQVLLGAAAAVGGAVTGNPMAWTLGVQALSLVAGLFRRRRPPAPEAP
jgi:hypothetical protein